MYGLQPAYWDVFGQRRHSSAEAITATLRALGAELHDPTDAEDAIHARREQVWTRAVDPVCVVRGGSGTIRVRTLARDARVVYRAVGEDGETRTGEWNLDAFPVLAGGTARGETRVLRHLPLPGDLPAGYHECTVQIGDGEARTLVVSAPDAATPLPAPGEPPGWGAFLPLYAVRSDGDWGVGDYGCLANLAERIAAYGGDNVATLPLLPTDGSSIGGPSPYSPVSRLFWSELFIDLDDVPETQLCPSKERLVDAPDAARRLEALRGADEVAYAEVTAIKRTLLQEIGQVLFADRTGGDRRQELEGFLASHPGVDTYARFRAAYERHGRPWMSWPTRLRQGEIRDDDFDQAVYRSHLVGQWLAHEQLGRAADRMQRSGVRLYLDLPVGVPRDSFDVWRYRDQFAEAASAGSPPDTFFVKGQNWALPPLHPERIRTHGHGYFRAALRHHLRTAGMLRIDHVMAFNRLFWIPEGFPARDGVYVRYPARELWAIVALESQRSRAAIIGEDLGTVPRAVRRAMRRHRAQRIFVVQTEVAEDRIPSLESPVPDAIACMNTHDMPTFASYLAGTDLEDLADLGALDAVAFATERDRRREKTRVLGEFLRHGGWLAGDPSPRAAAEMLRACLRFLADSEAASVVVNLEDLWLEPAPQNVPGTSDERPNWRRRARYTLDEIFRMPDVIDALDELDRRRRAALAN